jgi:hypothetical protein
MIDLLKTTEETELKTKIKLPITHTIQVQDGCVTASAKSFLPQLGIEFDTAFLPRLQRFQLDVDNPQNNHMLGVAVTAAEMGLSVSVNKINPELDDILPPDVPELAGKIHPFLCGRLRELSNIGIVELMGKVFNEDSLLQMIRTNLKRGQYIMPFLDWDKWNEVTQTAYGKYKNPRHIVSIYGLDGEDIIVHDPSLNPNENPVKASISHLLSALNEIQQIVSVGPHR